MQLLRRRGLAIAPATMPAIAMAIIASTVPIAPAGIEDANSNARRNDRTATIGTAISGRATVRADATPLPGVCRGDSC